MPLISVLMPVFNRELVVSDAIQSIRSQTFEDWELVILDDASTDKTVEICRKFAAEDPRIRVFTNDHNLGVGQTRTRLFKFASGTYIAIQDSDDVSVPERFAKQIEVLDAQHEIGLVCGVMAMIDDAGAVIRYFPKNLTKGEQYPQNKAEMVRLLYRGCKVVNVTCMFRRRFIEELAEPYGTYRVFEDWHFLLQVAHRALIWGIPEVLVRVRRGKSHQHLYNYNERVLREVCRFKRATYEYFKREETSSPINYWVYRQSMAHTLVRMGAHVGGWRGSMDFLHALLYDPFGTQTWKRVAQFTARALRRTRRIVARR